MNKIVFNEFVLESLLNRRLLDLMIVLDLMQLKHIFLKVSFKVDCGGMICQLECYTYAQPGEYQDKCLAEIWSSDISSKLPELTTAIETFLQTGSCESLYREVAKALLELTEEGVKFEQCDLEVLDGFAKS